MKDKRARDLWSSCWRIVFKSLWMFPFCSLMLCAAKTQPPEAFTPAIDVTKSKAKMMTQYVPIAVPGQLEPLHPRITRHISERISGLDAVKAANKKAMVQPASSDYINSITTYTYMPGALYQIYTAPLNVTDIEFETGEHVISVAAGDTLRWQVSRTFSGLGRDRHEHLLVKPIDESLNNNLVVMTDRRTYHLQLHSTIDSYMSSVRWLYSEGDQGFIQTYDKSPEALPSSNVSVGANMQGLELNTLDFNYHAEIVSPAKKSPVWMPMMVFNNGSKTFIQFPANLQQAPTLFVDDGNGQAHTVNYRVEGNYYIIDSVARRIELRVGQTDPTIVKVLHDNSD